jgi:Leucine-rich repeat (LRR) protein
MSFPVRLTARTATVRLDGKGLRALDLTPLAACENLKDLRLDDNALETVDLSPLAACPLLDRIVLDGNPLRKIDLGPLAGHPSLTSLSFGIGQMKTVDLSPLVTCPKLDRLGLYGTDGGALGALTLVFLRRLKTLSIRAGLRALDLQPLVGSPVQQLHLGANAFPQLSLEPLARCPQLEGLYLDGNPLRAISLEPLEACPQLRRLSFGSTGLTSIEVTALAMLPRLDYLFVEEGCEIVLEMAGVPGGREKIRSPIVRHLLATERLHVEGDML